MNEMVTVVETHCPFCGEIHCVEVPVEGLLMWEQGTPIQRAMPNLSADEREMLISGICPDCWRKTFG